MGDLGKIADGGQLSSYLPVAEVLRAGLYRILGMEPLEYRCGTRDELRASARTGRALRSGYFAYVNAPRSALEPASLWIRDGQLQIGTRQDVIKPLRGYDFCLVALEHHPLREHYTDLPFMRYWSEVQAMIWDGQPERAERFGLPALGRAIVGSPDLLPHEQTRVLELNRANFEAEVERWQAFVAASDLRKRAAATAAARGLRRGGSAAVLGFSGRLRLHGGIAMPMWLGHSMRSRGCTKQSHSSATPR